MKTDPVPLMLEVIVKRDKRIAELEAARDHLVGVVIAGLHAKVERLEIEKHVLAERLAEVEQQQWRDGA